MRATLRQGMHGVVEFDPNWKSILECAALEVFEIMVGVRLESNPVLGDEPRGEQTAMVGMAGALCGMTTLRCSRESSARLAALMLGEDSASTPSIARDALGELCNMVAGNFKGKISQLADHCMLSAPTVITGDDYSMSTLDPSEGLTVSFVMGSEPIWVSLIIHT